ncbi:MAG: NADH-quinone oxidoreductase subunit L [Candidatus Omnitrophica bacterium]|nr:NADH-quinone oxidoreductase subunit L [Candidatus Omnitrophota bacterium]
MGFELIFQFDKLGLFMAAVAGFVGALILVYSVGYMARYGHKIEFYGYMLLFLSAMMGLIFSANILLMYVFWEITAFCSWRLIGFYRGEKDLWCADKAFLVTFFGASLMLAGLIILYINHGTFDMAQLKGTQVSTLVFFLFMGGILSKSAQLPLSSWLPDAGVAPTPVTALLHAAVLVKIGVFAYCRLFCDILTVPQQAAFWAMVIVMLSGFVAALSALIDTNIKRILAYSTISQLSYIFLGFIVNTALSIAAALLYILVHSVGKAGLFLSAGVVEQSTHTKDINKLGGFLGMMPLLALGFVLSAFSIAGLPPFGGFFSKFYVVLGTAEAGHRVVAGVAMLTAVITLLYLLRFFKGVFLGECEVPAERSSPRSMISVVLVLGVVSLLIGLFAKFPLEAVNSIARGLVK